MKYSSPLSQGNAAWLKRVGTTPQPLPLQIVKFWLFSQNVGVKSSIRFQKSVHAIDSRYAEYSPKYSRDLKHLKLNATLNIFQHRIRRWHGQLIFAKSMPFGSLHFANNR
jgi:hypothetical protein